MNGFSEPTGDNMHTEEKEEGNMRTVFIVTRTCYGEDYSEPETEIEIYETRKKALERFGEIIKEEAQYMGEDDLKHEVIEFLGAMKIDHIDVDNDYRVVVTLEEREVK